MDAGGRLAMRRGLRAARAAARRKRRFSSVLRNLVRQPGEAITVRELSVIFEDRAFGALMLVFAAPNLIPAPINASAILGVPLIVITVQLAMGRSVLWLPAFIAGRSVPRGLLRTLVERALPYIRRAERLLSPRLEWLFGPIGDRLIGIVTLVLSVILFLPVPFGNWLPALSICVFALALLQRDGVAAILGYATAAASLVLVVVVAGGILLAVEAVFRFLWRELGG
ncbi:MAG: exopolysaccharide biosynthesis protein [Rhodospirillaceae bacterium]|nr:exopolysaccharide biosynthesis protein [Rhodospirillaceae bacterium]